MQEILRSHPHLYEINSREWLRRLQKKYGQDLSLTNVPIEEWEKLWELGFDIIWLMGVWNPSKMGVKVALSLPELKEEYDRALPKWNSSDVVGSPYAIASYELNPKLGRPEDLKKLHKVLNNLGLELVLDFVPNHVAIDHTWISTHPEYLIEGSDEDLQKHSSLFFEVDSPQGTKILAYGRDPYFPPWLDTSQLNIFNNNTRNAMYEVLNTIARMCDGLRCDMAMLVLNEVFQKTWGWIVERSGYKKPKDEFWKDAISNIRNDYPDFLFIAESYWDLGQELLNLGFDYVYDKTLYDHLRSANIQELKKELRNVTSYQRACVRFTENHDEARAVVAFGRERSKAASVITSTLMGMRLFHEGQLEGRKIKVPLQLIRVQPEEIDQDIFTYYRRLLHFADDIVLHDGEWTLLESRGVSIEDNSFSSVLAWMWQLREISKIIIINYSDSASQTYISLPSDFSGFDIMLYDELTGENYQLKGGIIQKEGLYVQLEPYSAHLFTIKKESRLL